MKKIDAKARKVASTEADILEKKILSDLAEMICEAHTAVSDAMVFQEFYKSMKGRTIVSSDFRRLKGEIEAIVTSYDPKFLDYFDVVVERDIVHRHLIGLEFKVKPRIFSAA